MDGIRMIVHIGILYLFYYAGVWIQETLNTVIPGSIIGMLLLLLFFYAKLVKPALIEKGANLLLSHMPLLFLPVTAGVMAHFSLFAGKGLILAVIAYISTLIVMLTAGWTAQWLVRRRESDG
ncbi:CidA/LrgA family protein [Salibacterium aidingense]|nr:CidA/LrgA family protein [Salibacterium aidingense]